MALTDILSVALAARDVLGEDKFSDSDCSSVAEAMKKAGLTTYASLRIGFPRDPEARSAMVRGWCKEVKLSDFFELVDAMATGALSFSLSTCSSPLVSRPGLFTAKRLHGGAWVESDSVVAKVARVSAHQVCTTLPCVKAVDSLKAASTLALVSASLCATSSSTACEQIVLPPSKLKLGSKYETLVAKDTACVM